MCRLAAALPFTSRAGFFFRAVVFRFRVAVLRRGFAFAFVVRLFFLVTRFLAVAISARVAMVMRVSG